MKLKLYLLLVTLLISVTSFSQVVTTFAGSGSAGNTDGLGTTASFNNPSGVAIDASGNVYVAEYNANRIRKITPAGLVSTFAGSGTASSTDGMGTAASFNGPFSVAIDASGNVYVAEYNADRIRKITPAGLVTTFAGSGTAGSTDGLGTAASFNNPRGVAVDASGNVYVADYSTNKIRKITPTGLVTTFAGSGAQGNDDGIGTAASFKNPGGIALDNVSGNIYVADVGNNKIRKITSAGVVSTFAGSGASGNDDGIGTAASFYYPLAVAADASGNVYVVEYNHKIRKITATGDVTTFAGSVNQGSTNGIGTASSFGSPLGISVNSTLSIIYVADSGNHLIRKITPLPATHLNFDGVDDVVSLTHFEKPNQFTVESWVKTSSTIQNTIIGWGTNAATFTSEFKIVGGQLVYAEYDQVAGLYQTTITTTTINDNNWHHVAVTRTSTPSNNVLLYIDGILNATGTATINTTTTELSIGAFSFGGNQQFFNGSIDDVRIWNNIRTAEQINGSKNCELQGSESGLVRYYKFNQGGASVTNTSITSVTDASVSASNGTLTNFALTGTTSNFLATSPVTTGSIVPSNASVTTPVVYNLGATATALTATTGANGNGLLWYTAATGGTGSTTAPTPSTATVGNTSYWVSSTNANGCESARMEIVVSVKGAATHLNFDGANDYVTIPTAVLNNLNQGTISTKIFLNSLTQQTITSKQKNSFNSYAIFMVGGNGSPSGKVSYQPYNGLNLVSNATLVTGQWYDLAITFNNSEARLYINGVLDRTMSGNFSLPNDLTVTATSIGAWLGDGGGQYLNGNLDELRVWNIVLTATDIANLMNCELQSSQPALVAYYKFNQGFNSASNSSVTTLTDASTNAYNGTLTNFALTGTTSNWLSGSPVTTGNTCATLNTNSFDITSNINIYPNPTNGNVNIMVNNLTNVSVSVYDLNGRTILNKELSANENTVDISNFQTGMYLFRIKSSEGEVVKKVIKN